MSSRTSTVTSARKMQSQKISRETIERGVYEFTMKVDEAIHLLKFEFEATTDVKMEPEFEATTNVKMEPKVVLNKLSMKEIK